MRTNGASAGTCDVYYFNPEGKRFRSRAEIARDYGIAAPTKRAKRGPAVKAPPKHEPLSREQAKEAAVKFAEEHVAPLRLLRDVKVVQFGVPSKEYSTEERLVMVGYRARWTDAQSKVVFESRIEEGDKGEGGEGGGGPSYNVYVIDVSADGKKLRYPVGKGSSPDDIWAKVEERQRAVLKREMEMKGGVGAGGSGEGAATATVAAAGAAAAASPKKSPGGKLSPVDTILKKVSHLNSVWGLEKYGFIDLTCLKAMEGQAGVDETSYKYVNERAGWVQEQMNLRSLLAERGQRLRGGLAGKAGNAGQIERVVERVMDSMLRKVLAWNEKYEAKLEKQKERERVRLQKQKEREQKQREKRLATEEINAALPDDLSFDGAKDVAPPASVPVSSLIGSASGECSQSDVEIVVEMWSLGYRFRDMLKIDTKSMPTVESMLKTYCQGYGACGMLIGMVDFLLSELCDDVVAQVMNGDPHLKRVDFVPPRSARMLGVTEDSWQNVLHRYLFMVAVAAARWADSTGKKEDLNFINYPVDFVHPYDVMDKVTTGPTMLELATGEMSLMLSDQAEHRIHAREDALALRAAATAATAGSALDEATVVKNDKMLRSILAKLRDVPPEAGQGGTMEDASFMSPESVLETRLGYPIDMSHVVSRVECLVYQMEADCFKSFAADVFFACKLLDVACKKDAAGKLGTPKQVAKRQAVARWIIQTLKELSDAHDASGVDGVLEALGDQTVDGQAVEGAAVPRNCAPAAGSCFVCWQKETQEERDQGNDLEACGSCGMVAHNFCLTREWNLDSMAKSDYASESTKCIMCCSASSAGVVAPGAAAAELASKQHVFPSGGYGTLWELVRSLYAVDFRDWKKEQKFELVRMVTLLVAESPVVRDLLDGDAERERAAKAKLQSCRAELKQLQQETKKLSATPNDAGKANDGENGNGNDKGAEAPTAQQSRAIREVESKREGLVMQISKIEEELKHFKPSRKQLLGFDRHWNKYWSLPSGSLDRPEPFIIVEHDYASADGVESPDMAFYRGMDALESLIEFVNEKAARESVLGTRLTKLKDAFAHDVQDMDVDVAPNDAANDAANGVTTDDADKMSSLERFKATLLEFGNGLPNASFNEVRGTQAIRDAWSRKTASMSSPNEAIALLVALERMLDPTCFKVHWRSWGVPAPDASLATKNLAPAFMRLENLKKAVKLSSNRSYSLSMLDVEDVGAGAGDQEADEDQDSELARNLDAELNRRRDTKSRRNWQVTSPRNRRGMSIASYKEESDDDDGRRADDPDESMPSGSDDETTE